ncbi:hypothetical protein VTN02DRAFT_5086 [Thermoascus thermophilus]
MRDINIVYAWLMRKSHGVYFSPYAGLQIRPLNRASSVLLAANGIRPGIAMCMVPTHHDASAGSVSGMLRLSRCLVGGVGVG